MAPDKPPVFPVSWYPHAVWNVAACRAGVSLFDAGAVPVRWTGLCHSDTGNDQCGERENEFLHVGVPSMPNGQSDSTHGRAPRCQPMATPFVGCGGLGVRRHGNRCGRSVVRERARRVFRHTWIFVQKAAVMPEDKSIESLEAAYRAAVAETMAAEAELLAAPPKGSAALAQARTRSESAIRHRDLVQAELAEAHARAG